MNQQVPKEAIKDLYISQPLPASNLFHIFDARNQSLCGKTMILRVNPDYCQPVTGKEKWAKGQDCKSCFNKLKKIIDGK